MNYMIVTASAIESNRLQQTRWIPSVNLAPVSLLGGRGVHLGAPGWDLYYTDGALEALVRSAATEGREWTAWREALLLFKTVRPYEAWEFLHESTVEELTDRDRASYCVLSSATKLEAAAPTLSYLDLVNFERRHCAATVRAAAAERMVRIAARRIVITEEQEANLVTVRATWAALPAADLKAPEWLISGLDTKSMAGVE